MPRQSRSGGQRRAQGGGRIPNSEPRLQVFRDFAGVNFEHADRLSDDVSVDHERTDGGDQTDLQMNYVFLQNNVSVASNKTLETRDDIVPIFYPTSGEQFTGAVRMVGPTLFASMTDGILGYGSVYPSSPRVIPSTVSIGDHTGSGHDWTSMEYYDDKLIALTKQGEVWTADIDRESYAPSGSIENATPVPDPTTDFTGHLHGMGSLVVSSTMTEQCPFRTQIAHTYVTKYGPTRVSPTTVFYTSVPASEWHSGCYLQIDGTVPNQEYGVKAIELYYSADNAMSLIFLGRVDVRPDQRVWTYDWYGYVDATSMWPVANMVPPTENYTRGVHASRVTVIDGRMYFWGDPDNPQRLYIGGNPGNLLSVSQGTGGGFVDVEPGTQQEVKYVCKYKTQSGNSIVTMLCDAPNSHREQRFNLVENTVSLSNEQSMRSWQAEQVAGAIGCKSFNGALVCEDGLYSVSRHGLALTTMTMEYNSQIRTNYVSDAIKPVFYDTYDIRRLAKSVLLEHDNVIYMAIGTTKYGDDELYPAVDPEESNLENVIFCYDIDSKAWWTYTIDVPYPILNMFHIDWHAQREGIGIVTADCIYMLPLTNSDDESTIPNHDFLIETAEISTQMPQQSWQYLSQLEFHFDHFVGEMTIKVRMVDMFGRSIEARKVVSEDDVQFGHVVRMRIDQRVMSYVITMSGQARFRLTHFIARVYTMSDKIGQVWGFDDSISHRSAGSIHPTFKCYNDVRKAIFT